MGVGPVDPPSLRGGPAGNELALLVGVSGMSLSWGVGPPDPPQALWGPGSHTCLPCSFVSGTPSCLWRWLFSPSAPVGPAVSNLALSLLHHRTASLVCIIPGLWLASSLTLWGQTTPPTFHSWFILPFGLCPIILSPLGPLSLRHLNPTPLGGVSFLFNRAIPKTIYPTTGGSGRGACPPVPPLPPPLPAARDWGGGPTNQGPLSFLFMVARVLRTPPAPLGAGSQQLGSAVD